MSRRVSGAGFEQQDELMAESFKGGVHPCDRKDVTASLPIVDAPPPARAAILLSQHLGAPCRPAVAVGDRVRTGQRIGAPHGFISAPVHASITGVVVAIEDRPSPVTGARTPAVVIERDAAEDAWAEGADVEQDVSALTPEIIRERVLDAGIVGLGGATFPTHVKLSPPPEKPIDTAILNGAECEPWLNCDNRLMIEEAAGVLDGFRYMMRALNCPRGIVAMESNKPEAARAMREALGGDDRITVALLPVKYPQGAEHQLIKALLGREVPWRGGLPMAVGVVVQNVATAYATWEAVRFRRPITRRVITVAGDGVERPGNYRVRLGTPVSELLALCGLRPEARRLVLGGPMMGIAQRTSEVSVIKGTSGVLALTAAPEAAYGPCIRCGRCVRACPYGLTPAEISRAVEKLNMDAAVEWNVLECKECGCCTYVCPARRPIVQQVKLAKAEVARRKARAK